MKPFSMIRRAVSGVALISVGVLLMGLLPAAAASAKLGQAATDGLKCGGSGEFSGVQETTSGSVPSYKVPSGVTKITSWSTEAGTDGGSMALEIWRPTSTARVYKLVGISPTEVLTPSKLNTFRLASPIAVKKGDLLGFDVTTADCSVTVSGPKGDLAGGTVGAESSRPKVGTTDGFMEQDPGVKWNISAVGV